METYQKNSGGNWCCQISISPGTRTPLLFLIETHSLTRSLLLQVFCQTQVIIVQGSLYYSLVRVATSPSSGYCELQILPCYFKFLHLSLSCFPHAHSRNSLFCKVFEESVIKNVIAMLLVMALWSSASNLAMVFMDLSLFLGNLKHQSIAGA